jgi:hypothetical protein
VTRKRIVKDKKYWQCSRKICYSDWVKADKDLTKGLRDKHYTQNYHVYRCPFCQNFHIGRRK